MSTPNENELIDFDLSNLKPPIEANKLQHPENYIHHVKENNYHVRKIFYNVEFSDYENEKVTEFDNELKKRNIPVPENWDKAKSLKYCLTGQMILEDSIKAFQEHVQWLNDPFSQKFSQKALKLVEKGLIYQSGRDKKFRPVVYFNVIHFDSKNNIDIQLQAISNVLQRIAKYMYLKGKIENQVVILDLKGVGAWSLPIDLIKKLIHIITINFTCSLHKMYILNPPGIIKMSWNVIKKFMVEETSNKINMLGEKDFKEMQKDIDPSQLQQKYGGTLPNITKYWPPQNTYKIRRKSSYKIQGSCDSKNLDELQMQKRKSQETNLQESEYYTIVNNSVEFYEEEEEEEELEYRPDSKSQSTKDRIWHDGKEIDIGPDNERPTCCACNIF